jgi:hypothetical protein
MLDYCPYPQGMKKGNAKQVILARLFRITVDLKWWLCLVEPADERRNERYGEGDGDEYERSLGQDIRGPMAPAPGRGGEQLPRTGHNKTADASQPTPYTRLAAKCSHGNAARGVWVHREVPQHHVRVVYIAINIGTHNNGTPG